MTDALVSPSRTVSLGETKYTLDASFATLRAVQEAFARDVVQVLIGIDAMRLDELAKLVAIGSGRPDQADAIGQLALDEVGALGRANVVLRSELFAWLNVAMSPKAEREKKSAEMDAMVDRSRSRGPSTSGSPSGASGGSPANSGGATPGS